MKKILSAAILAFLLSVSLADAEQDQDYLPFIYNPEDPSTIYLEGEIDRLSLWKFANLLDRATSASTIVLSSSGGDVYSALILAKQIERMGLHTVVMEFEKCYSACAFLYFAGANRTAKGSVGVHQISSSSPDLNSGQVALADIFELMESFSVPNDVILKMLRTAPEDMHIYDGSELDALGLTGPRPTSPDASPPPSEQDSSKDLPDLADGSYSGKGPYESTVSLRVNGEFGSVSVVSPSCRGEIKGLVRRLQTKVGIAAAHCFILIENDNSGGLLLTQGSGCTYYHGVQCSLSGTVKKDE